MESNYYTLPSSRDIKVLDRFSLLADIDDNGNDPSSLEDPATGLVPFWPLLQSLLHPKNKIETLPELTSLLDTISVTLRGTSNPAGDYGLLKEAIPSRCNGGEGFFFNQVWPRLAQLALQMPALFPSGRLPALGTGPGAVNELVLSRRQVACLVVHQFFRTLLAPEWKREEDGFHDFGLWYPGMEEERQPSAARAYLAALMRYLEEVSCRDEVVDDGEWEVAYNLRSVKGRDFMELLQSSGCPLGEVEVKVVERYDILPASLGISGGAAVVSANKYIGFGKSATQEEIHVGSSPEACPAVLITPPLRDDQVLIVRGAQPMVNITGQRRDIRVEEMPVPDGGGKAWRERTMLFMDALELDMAEAKESLPDLLPGNLDREIRKAYTAFSSRRVREIRTGLWGCGAFCGDPGIKGLLLWLAASLANTRLLIVCDRGGLGFAKEFQCAVNEIRRTIRDTAALRELLDRVPDSLARGRTLSWVIEQLEQRPVVG
ncbi:putative poly glycohydrolase [Achaetomium macrosporum]|uniref:poly(ADP-ribose) glycohydrolase n=1 Tax=Achaetomium macrosporum TaxID=79813 RepID=A0AAN7CF41_9PEZI|nr:putative poly glycohydrolase [Achaetomium macrosporum]